jgi:D-galactosaminyltransferase
LIRNRWAPFLTDEDADSDTGTDRDTDGGLANEGPERAIAYGLLGLGVVIGLVTWLHGIGGHGLVPPSSDAAYHGFFVARIMETHSIDVAKIAVSDPAGHFPLVSYYPFAMHALAAVGAQLTGADIGRLLVAFTVLFSAVILPFGMFVLARMLAPTSALTAGFTALLVPSVALFPYAPVQFGDIPIIVGMALVPITVVLVTEAAISGGAESSFPVRLIVPAGLAVVTIVAVHSSQLPLTIVLVALLVLERSVRARSAELFKRSVLRALMVSAVAVVLFAPSLRSFANGVSERSGFDNTPVRALHDVIGSTLALDPGAFGHPARQTGLAVLAAVGVLIWLLRRRFAWVIGYALVVAVMLFAAVSDSALSKALSLPWYRGPARIGWNRAFFVPFFCGVAIACAVGAVVRRRGRSRASLVVASLTAVVIVGAAIGYRGYRTSTDMVRDSFSQNALVTGESEAAFAWLDRHARPGDTVVNDVNSLGITTDDSVWMYAQRRLTPLFGFAQVTSSGFAPPDRATLKDQRDRAFLLTHLQLLDRDKRVRDLARRYRVRWVYFDERSITIFRNTLDLAGLSTNPSLRPAFRRGPVHVFELKPLPSR